MLVRRGEHAIVLGAGVQGICAALALDVRGYRVTLVDRMPDCMMRASIVNEGKIHLGFVYANDASFRTSGLMLQAALTFANQVQALLGGTVDWSCLRSLPYTYAILRESILSLEQIIERYHQLQYEYEKLRASSGLDYLGTMPERLWRETPHARIRALLNPGRIAALVETVEVALDLPRFRLILRDALEHRSIERLYSHTVNEVSRRSAGFTVEGVRDDGLAWKREGAVVVNCLWDGRLAVDRQMGIVPRRKWVYRLKYGLHGDLPPALARLTSLTLVLGPFGDIVVKPDVKTYFSWYAKSLRGWSHALTPPADWRRPIKRAGEDHEADALAGEILNGFEPYIPGIAQSQVHTISAGTNFSWGETDIDDPQSELHERYDIGVHAYDGYFSIDTGKFTCAPLFAKNLMECLK